MFGKKWQLPLLLSEAELPPMELYKERLRSHQAELRERRKRLEEQQSACAALLAAVGAISLEQLDTALGQGESMALPAPLLQTGHALVGSLGSSLRSYVEQLGKQQAEMQSQQRLLVQQLEACAAVEQAASAGSTAALGTALFVAAVAQVNMPLLQPGSELLQKLEARERALQGLTAASDDDLDGLIEVLAAARIAGLPDHALAAAERALTKGRIKGANVVFSVKYDVQGAAPYAQLLDAALRKHGLHTYNPNRRTKKDCGTECSEIGYGCQKVPYSPPTRPTDADCWQSSYRWHLEFPDLWGIKPKSAVMLCIKEGGTLGQGQLMEKRMAENLGILRIEVDAPAAEDPLDFVTAFPAVYRSIEDELRKHGIF